jgi:fructose-1,6-bisphosphatase I
MPDRIITIERHILEQQRTHPGATGVFTGLLYDMALVAKIISRETTRAGLVNILGTTDQSNVYGERQTKLDIFANEVIVRMNEHTGRLCAMASEESEHIIPIPEGYPCGRYILIFDPLDGSSNVDVNVTVGTIFSVLRRPDDQLAPASLEDMLQPGCRQVAAGYVVYGSSTMMVYATDEGVHGFTLDPGVGEFLLSHPNITIPEKPKYYSVNQSYERYWREGVRRYVHWLQGEEEVGPRLSGRYIGSLVADFHRNLLTGGVYLYPADTRDPKQPHGKLRLMCEANPLAFIVKQAGGYASDGVHCILDIQPTSLHQRVPLFIGNRDLVEKAEEYIREYEPEWVEAYSRQVKVATPEPI